MNLRQISKGFPARKLRSFSAGCPKKNGNDGTRKLKPTLRLASSISWCARPRRGKLDSEAKELVDLLRSLPKPDEEYLALFEEL